MNSKKTQLTTQNPIFERHRVNGCHDASSHSASASRTAAKRERIRSSAVFGHGCSCMS